MSQKIFHRHWIRPMFLSLVMVSADAYPDVVVIVSANSPVTSLTTEQTAKIFLGKTDTFPNDIDAFPIDQAEGNAIRDEFYSKITHKNSSQVTAYWAKIIFSGDSRPPLQLEGNVSIKKAVANNPNAIGYIDKNAVDSSVKVILIP